MNIHAIAARYSIESEKKLPLNRKEGERMRRRKKEKEKGEGKKNKERKKLLKKERKRRETRKKGKKRQKNALITVKIIRISSSVLVIKSKCDDMIT